MTFRHRRSAERPAQGALTQLSIMPKTDTVPRSPSGDEASGVAGPNDPTAGKDISLEPGVIPPFEVHNGNHALDRESPPSEVALEIVQLAPALRKIPVEIV